MLDRLRKAENGEFRYNLWSKKQTRTGPIKILQHKFYAKLFCQAF